MSSTKHMDKKKEAPKGFHNEKLAAIGLEPMTERI